MTDIVRRFAVRLSQDAIARLFLDADLPAPDFEGLGPRQRIQRVVERILKAPDAKRGRLEGIAGHVLALANLDDHAERALRAVCRNQQRLLKRLEDDCSLEERILDIWFSDRRILDRARNLAMGYVWRDGRSHCSFMVSNPQQAAADLNQAVEAIREKIQKFQGGRKVYSEFFEYADEDGSGASEGSPAQTIHHIALYLETPASYLMEFPEGKDVAIPILHRAAREVAIDYDPGTGRLDIAGKGIGGAKIFADISEEFRLKAVAGAELTKIRRKEWPLHMFLGEVPSLAPPDGFSKVCVSELVFRSERQSGGKVIVRAGEDQSAYDRMREIGIHASRLLFERVQAATLTLETLPEHEDNPGREVRLTLSWPNACSFVGATVYDRRVIDAWLKQPPFAQK
jgi:hypothetical protein